MAATFERLVVPDVILCRPKVFGDSRGFFVERYRKDLYSENGINCEFVQTNHSFSRNGVIRGMHYQLRHPQAKLVSVMSGKIFDVAVDIRRGSPTFGKWAGAVLTGEGAEQLFIPCGFAHGFQVLSDEVHFLYQCSDYYAPGDEAGFRWDSQSLGIQWRGTASNLSPKDAAMKSFDDVPDEMFPVYDK